MSKIKKLCSRHDVERLYAFGSVTTNQFDISNSDIDLLIDIPTIDPLERGERLIAFWDELELLLNRRVDLLTPTSVKNPILQNQLNRNKLLIYDRSGEKISI